MTIPATERTNEQLIDGLCIVEIMLANRLDKIDPKEYGHLQDSKAEIRNEILRRMKGAGL